MISSSRQLVLRTRRVFPALVDACRPSRAILSLSRRGQSRSMASDEVSKAREMAGEAKTGPTIFTKILNKEIPATIVHEDDKCMAFRDVNPVSPTHILVIPRKPIPTLSAAQDEDTMLLGHLLQVARKVAEAEKLDKGYRIVINNGEHGAQSVYHLHLHVVGGRQFSWPPG